MTLEQALEGTAAPQEVAATQVLLDLEFLDFEGKQRVGQLLVHRELEEEVRAIFADILAAQFPIYEMKPVVVYGWSDDISMQKNNCSAFNYRLKVGKNSLSTHSLGRAIDINPLQNPYIRGDLVLPPGAVYQPELIGTILDEGSVVAAFESRGWEWGGRWTSLKDWHHFEKMDAAQ
jgi:hypothetical protein